MRKRKCLVLWLLALAGLTAGRSRADMIVTTSAPTAAVETINAGFTLNIPATPVPSGYHVVGATLEMTAWIYDNPIYFGNESEILERFVFLASGNATILSNSADATLDGLSTSPSAFGTPSTEVLEPQEQLYLYNVGRFGTTGTVAVTNPSAYLGGDTIIGSTATSVSITGGDGNIISYQQQVGYLNGQLVFDFAPTVPEPSTLGLLPTAFLWLTYRRRSQRASSVL